MSTTKMVTGIAPVNIAVIKYWGKRDENLILPLNSSVSCTLDTDFMCAKTTIMASPSFLQNKMWLNNKEVDFNNERLQKCLAEVKKRANPVCGALLMHKLHICSENNFPTAAGLASSAAGYACLVSTLAELYHLKGDISGIARMGSGSACRSVYGGFVEWNKGEERGGGDSVASQIASAAHWPDLHVLILVVSDSQKKCSSTSGMQRSVKTSKLLKFRADHVVPRRVNEMTDAIINKNFVAFAKITMQDSNQFHAMCLDTYPPCFYMNDVSRDIVEFVHAYNEFQEATKVAYTFDAGPNACLFLLKQDVDTVVAALNAAFPTTAKPEEYFKGLPVNPQNVTCNEAFNLKSPNTGRFKYIIHTKLGDGPKILTNPAEHLLNEEGLPVKFVVENPWPGLL